MFDYENAGQFVIIPYNALSFVVLHMWTQLGWMVFFMRSQFWVSYD